MAFLRFLSILTIIHAAPIHSPSGSPCVPYLSNQHICTYNDHIKFRVLSSHMNSPPSCIDLCNDDTNPHPEHCLQISCSHFKTNLKNFKWQSSFNSLQRRLGIAPKDLRIHGKHTPSGHPDQHTLTNCGLAPHSYQSALRKLQRAASSIPNRIHRLFNDNVLSLVENSPSATEKLNDAVQEWKQAITHSFPESKRSLMTCILNNVAHASRLGEDPSTSF